MEGGQGPPVPDAGIRRWAVPTLRGGSRRSQLAEVVLIDGVGQAGADIFLGQLGVIAEDVGPSISIYNQRNDVADRDPGSLDHGRGFRDVEVENQPVLPAGRGRFVVGFVLNGLIVDGLGVDLTERVARIRVGVEKRPLIGEVGHRVGVAVISDHRLLLRGTGGEFGLRSVSPSWTAQSSSGLQK